MSYILSTVNTFSNTLYIDKCVEVLLKSVSATKYS